MKPKIFISGLSYTLGEKCHNIDTMSPNLQHIEALKRSGFENYFSTQGSMLDLAKESLRKTLSSIEISPEKIDTILIVTSTFNKTFPLSHKEMSEFLIEFKLSNAYPLLSSLSYCGNLIPALEKGYHYLNSNNHKNILVLISDVVPQDSTRITPPNVAIGSDASACLLMSKETESDLILNCLYHTSRTYAGTVDPIENFSIYTQLVRDGVREVSRPALKLIEEIGNKLNKVFMNNYSKNVCRSYLRLMGLPLDYIDYTNIPRFGHAGATDICINLHDYLSIGNKIQFGQSFLLISTGPFMWGSAVISTNS